MLSMAGIWGLMYVFVPDENRGYFYQSNIDIDLNSGALREWHYFWIIPVKREVIETPFFKMVSEYVEITEQPVWKEDRRGVGFWPAKRGGGGGRLPSLCSNFADMIDISKRYGLSEEDKKDYVIKARGLLRDTNIEALEDLYDKLSSQLGFFVPNRDVLREITSDESK